MALAEMKLRKLKEEALTSWTDNPREKLFGGAVQHAGLLAGDDPRALETGGRTVDRKGGAPLSDDVREEISRRGNMAH